MNYLLSKPSEKQNPEEDLMILQDDGSRACFNWELRGKGYHMVNNFYENKKDSKSLENMSDDELLRDAYQRLENNKK